MDKLINNEVRPRRDEFGRILCECCDRPTELIEEGLCESCQNELNRPWDSDFIGYRKGK